VTPLAQTAIGRIRAAASRSRRREPSWVTKTDLTRYLRCPYAFFQLSQGMVAPEDLLDDMAIKLIDDGVRFERDVVQDAVPSPVGLDLAALFAGDARLVGLPILENPALRLRGTPDGIVANAGALLPIEIKSHRDLRRSDELELTFYWLLLDVHRTRQTEPRGFVILRRDGVPHEVEVPITEQLLSEARTLIAEVRVCRTVGAKPRVCSCTACRGPLREAIEQSTCHGRDLTRIWGVGRKFAAVLEAHGVADYAALIEREPAVLAAAVRGPGRSISAAMIVRWQEHARSYLNGAPVVFAPPLALDEFIAVDLEYNPISGHVWLAGLHVVLGDRREEHALWADTPSEEAEMLRAIARITNQHAGLPIVTWGGGAADIPVLRNAAVRLGQSHLVANVLDRHVDAFRHAATSWRAPIPSLSITPLASYFAVVKTSKIRDGLEAQFIYDRYRTATNTTERATLRERLVAYNRDDVLATIGILQAIRMLAPPDGYSCGCG